MHGTDLSATLRYLLVEQCPSEDYAVLRNKLEEYNVSQLGNFARQSYLFAYYDADNAMRAGLYARCRLGEFYIDLLWVDAAMRGRKLGTELMLQAEERARQDGALYIRANTATFQALPFYLKQGYQVFAKLPLAVNTVEPQYDHYLIKYLP